MKMKIKNNYQKKKNDYDVIFKHLKTKINH